jgi:hypothetical protein
LIVNGQALIVKRVPIGQRPVPLGRLEIEAAFNRLMVARRVYPACIVTKSVCWHHRDCVILVTIAPGARLRLHRRFLEALSCLTQWITVVYVLPVDTVQQVHRRRFHARKARIWTQQARQRMQTAERARLGFIALELRCRDPLGHVNPGFTVTVVLLTLGNTSLPRVITLLQRRQPPRRVTLVVSTRKPTNHRVACVCRVTIVRDLQQ